MYQRYMKRFLDFFLALCGCIILSPVLGVVAILVRMKLGSPVIFKQQRPGLNEKIFTLYKFRTMTDKRDTNGELLPDGVRLTPFGKMLRSTSLDELPELFNILQGTLAIVGPRPQLVKDMVFMSNEERQRHTVRPGLTGLAQVSGRNAIGWKERLQFDLKYIHKISFINDCRIIFKTIVQVLKKDGINTEGQATSEDFGDYLLRIGKVTQEEYDSKIKEYKEILGRS